MSENKTPMTGGRIAGLGLGVGAAMIAVAVGLNWLGPAINMHTRAILIIGLIAFAVSGAVMVKKGTS